MKRFRGENVSFQLAVAVVRGGYGIGAVVNTKVAINRQAACHRAESHPPSLTHTPRRRRSPSIRHPQRSRADTCGPLPGRFPAAFVFRESFSGLSTSWYRPGGKSERRKTSFAPECCSNFCSRSCKSRSSASADPGTEKTQRDGKQSPGIRHHLGAALKQ